VTGGERFQESHPGAKQRGQTRLHFPSCLSGATGFDTFRWGDSGTSFSLAAHRGDD